MVHIGGKNYLGRAYISRARHSGHPSGSGRNRRSWSASSETLRDSPKQKEAGKNSEKMIQHKKEGDNLKEGKSATVEGNVEIEVAREEGPQDSLLTGLAGGAQSGQNHGPMGTLAAMGRRQKVWRPRSQRSQRSSSSSRSPEPHVSQRTAS
jgi:hypothetical protein